MAAHLDTITRELAHTAAGVNQVITMVGEADQCVQRSIAAAARGGFTAMAANLHAAQQQLRVIHATLNTARDHVARAAAPVAGAPKQADAEQILALLAPLTQYLDQARSTVTQATDQIPPTIQRIASSANRNPAIGILTNVGDILGQTLRRAATVKDTIAAALADAKAAQSGER